MLRDSSIQDSNVSEFSDTPFSGIDGRVAEEVEEEGLGEGVELDEGVAALSPQRFGLIQDCRNPPLLRQRREGDFETLQKVFRHSALTRATSHLPLTFEPNTVLTKKVEQEARISTAFRSSDDMELG